RRQRSGEGCIVDSSLLSYAVWQMAPDVMSSVLYPDVPKPMYDREFVGNPLANAYRTADGRIINLVLLNADRHWFDFCRCIGEPELAIDERFATVESRKEHRRELVELLDELLALAESSVWKERLATMTGAWAMVQPPNELTVSAQVRATGYRLDVEDADVRRFSM